MNDKENFIADLYPAATKISRETGMSRELILAQAAQETGWGKHVLDGTSNIFNIKATGGWEGPTKTFNVWEIENGKKIWKDQEFRVYGSVEEALRDRVKFLHENPRYTKAGLFDEETRGSLAKEADALQKGGYATDPNYAKQLAAVYNSPIMQRAIQHAQEKTQASGQTQTTLHKHPLQTNHQTGGADGLLRQGGHGEAVSNLQTDLGQLGYYINAQGHTLKADGDFGARTRHAVEAFQRDHHLTVDGKVGPKTLEALHALSHAHARDVPLRLDDKPHPDHALFQQARGAVHQLDAQHGRAPDRHSDHLAAALVVAARGKGLTRIDQALLSEDGDRTFAVQGEPSSPFKQIAHVQTAHAVNTSLEQSSVAWQQLMQAKPTAPALAPPLAPPHEQAAHHTPFVISR
jgi:DNA-binding phage protein